MNVNDTEIAWSILQRSGYLRTRRLEEVLELEGWWWLGAVTVSGVVGGVLPPPRSLAALCAWTCAPTSTLVLCIDTQDPGLQLWNRLPGAVLEGSKLMAECQTKSWGGGLRVCVCGGCIPLRNKAPDHELPALLWFEHMSHFGPVSCIRVGAHALALTCRFPLRKS